VEDNHFNLFNKSLLTVCIMKINSMFDEKHSIF